MTTDEFVPERHPIRRIRAIVDDALRQLGPELGDMYSAIGRPSIPPEHLVKASVLMALYSIRSERQFCERLQYDLLFKWFLGLNITDPAFDHSTLSKNRERFLRDDIALALLGAVTREAQRRKLVSEDHFSVDGTLLQAWASLKSVRPRDEEPPAGPGAGGRNPDIDFRGQARRNDTHVSTTDPEARLARKGPGQETRLSFAGHVLMENRNGLILDILVTQADGRAERVAALAMLDRRAAGGGEGTLAADKGYDTSDFVAALRARKVAPHIARNTNRRRSAVDDATAASAGYALSQRVRKRIEECFGWMKTVGGGRKLRYIGRARNQLWAAFTAVAYNLTRMANLEARAA